MLLLDFACLKKYVHCHHSLYLEGWERPVEDTYPVNNCLTLPYSLRDIGFWDSGSNKSLATIYNTLHS
jgi:hypothetical protein